MWCGLQALRFNTVELFLRAYVKSHVYADKPETIDPLEGNIRRIIADIRPRLLQKVVENWSSRLLLKHIGKSYPYNRAKFFAIRLRPL